jgi:hypothetical protein
MIVRQVSGIDDAVASYFDRNPIRFVTRDGVSIEDALTGLIERITSLTTRFVGQDESVHRLGVLVGDCCTKAEFETLSHEVEKSSEIMNSTAITLEAIQKDIIVQKANEEGNWDTIKQIFREQIAQYATQLDDKVSSADMEGWVRHSELAELMALVSAVPSERRPLIPDILPKVLANAGLTMEEKLQRAYDGLSVERERIKGERTETGIEFRKLKELHANFQTLEQQRGGVHSEADYIEVPVRDVATDVGVCDAGEERHQHLLRNGHRASAETFFDGPEKCLASRTAELGDLLDKVSDDEAPPKAEIGDLNEVIQKVFVHCQGFIERQMELVLGAIGIKIDRNDIVTLVHQLQLVRDVQTECQNLKRKLTLKVDLSEFNDVVKTLMTREEFFQRMGPATPVRQPMGDTPKLATCRSTSSAKKPQATTRPVPLVPARTPLMMGVNDKFLKGKDNKLYLRETGQVGDRAYREPSVTGQPRGYYERSRMAMELDGAEAVFDFQPFVPADEAQADPVSRVKVEPYDFDHR